MYKGQRRAADRILLADSLRASTKFVGLQIDLFCDLYYYVHMKISQISN
jgi:hypothetical protein